VSKGYKTIKQHKKQHTSWITLSRPNKLNAINNLMLDELSEAIDNAKKDPDVKCIIITGTGERAFSAGADITELQKLNSETAKAFSMKGQRVFSKLEALSKPVIATIGGYALGGGLELALACDFRIAADCSVFGCPEAKLGFIPGWGATQRLPLVVGLSSAKRLIMAGEMIPADEAYRIGLVDKVVSYEKLEVEAEALASKLCEYPAEALKHAKQVLNSAGKADLESGLKRETEAFGLLFSLEETRKRVASFGSQRNKK
jgi:enoyl-CoA hydratase/carnithine racemase